MHACTRAFSQPIVELCVYTCVFLPCANSACIFGKFFPSEISLEAIVKIPPLGITKANVQLRLRVDS